MRFSNIYFGMTIVGVTMGVILGIMGQYVLMSLPILIGFVFFAVFLFARIFETLQELEKRSIKSYKEMEDIFREKFVRERKKGSRIVKSKYGSSVRRRKERVKKA